MVTMDFETFVDLMCCENDKGICGEFIRKQVTPKGYLKSILNQVYDMSSDYKYDNISKNNYTSNIEQYLDIDLILNPPNWYGSKVDIYNELEFMHKKIQDSLDVVNEDHTELHDVLLLVKQSLESSDAASNDSTYFELIRLAIINGYKCNYKFINLLRKE